LTSRTMESILTLDIGTTNIKAAVVSLNGKTLDLIKAKSPILASDAGSFEHEPRQLLNEVINLIKALAAKHRSAIKAIALSSYISNLLLVDDRGNELTNIITWLDRRPVKVLDNLSKLIDPHELYRRTGCPPLYLYVPPKIYWLSTSSNLVSKARYLLDAKSYILFKLMNEPYIDLSTASASQLLNIHSLKWDDLVLSSLGIDEGKLPRLVEADEIIGYIPRAKALELGLNDEVPIVPCLYDGASFIIGLGGLEVGVGSSHIGTSAMLRVVSDSPLIDLNTMELHTYYLCRGLWIPGGAIGNAGLTLDWLSSLVGREVNILLNNMAPLSSSLPLTIPILTPERFPKLTRCSGILSYGMKLEDRLNVLTTSLVLGFLFMLRRFSDLVESHGIKLREIRVGGGVAESDNVLYLMSNVLGTKVLRPKNLLEGGLLGNALIAFKALGYFKSLNDAFNSLGVEFDVFQPKDELINISKELYIKFKSLLKIYTQLCSELT